MLNRRQVLTGAGAAFLSGRVRAGDRHREKKAFEFRPYRPGQTLAPVICVTPGDGFYIHSFYDVCPWSAPGRYLAVLRMPRQDRPPDWRDQAEICVIDLTDRTIQTVYTTDSKGVFTCFECSL